MMSRLKRRTEISRKGHVPNRWRTNCLTDAPIIVVQFWSVWKLSTFIDQLNRSGDFHHSPSRWKCFEFLLSSSASFWEALSVELSSKMSCLITSGASWKVTRHLLSRMGMSHRMVLASSSKFSPTLKSSSDKGIGFYQVTEACFVSVSP